MSREIVVIDREERKSFWLRLDSDYTILFSPSIKPGLKMVSEKVDIVFLNITLPGIDTSRDLLNALKQQYPSIVTITIGSCEKENEVTEAFHHAITNRTSSRLTPEETLEQIRGLLGANEVHGNKPDSSDATHDEEYPGVPPRLAVGVLRVRDFLLQNYSESLTLTQACKMADISKTYFCRFFKNITSRSFRSFQHYVKIRAAEELLKNKNLSIKDIALKVGYRDPNYFSTVYKKITGEPPRRQSSKKS